MTKGGGGMTKYQYETCCINSTAKDINKMVDNAVDITYETLNKHVASGELMQIFSAYDWGPGNKGGLRLKDDWAVSYHKSMYKGQPCYYVRHSAIEYIFTPNPTGRLPGANEELKASLREAGASAEEIERKA